MKQNQRVCVCTVHLVHFHTLCCTLWILYYSIFLHRLVKQLNSTSHPVGVADKRKEVLANLFIFPNLKNSQLFLLKILIVLQSSKLTSMLFHISIILLEKKYFLTSRSTCRLYNLKSWPLSSVLDRLKKNIIVYVIKTFEHLNSIRGMLISLYYCV